MSRAEKIKSQLVSCPEAQYEDMSNFLNLFLIPIKIF